ncbi:MAG TPA: hypothetical protein VGD63_16380 [Steroidobacteraceae bacterium]
MDGAQAIPPGDTARTPDDFQQDHPLRIPYVFKAHVFLASVDHINIGWRVFDDWSAKFEDLKDGIVSQRAAFAVGMTPGKVEKILVNPSARNASAAQ